MSEWRYHLLLRLGVLLKRTGIRIIEAADFNPCGCERARIDAFMEEHGKPARGPIFSRTVSNTAPLRTFTTSTATTYYIDKP